MARPKNGIYTKKTITYLASDIRVFIFRKKSFIKEREDKANLVCYLFYIALFEV